MMILTCKTECPKAFVFAFIWKVFILLRVLLLEEVILCQIPVCVHHNSTFLVLIELGLLLMHVLLKNTRLQHKFARFIVISHAFHVTG